jgi:hypothetical protein
MKVGDVKGMGKMEKEHFGLTVVKPVGHMLREWGEMHRKEATIFKKSKPPFRCNRAVS